MISRRWELAVLAAILIGSLFVRTVNLSSLPAGFHGDEAVTGLEGQRILREGYIGPYSREAAGQPSGPLYLTAASVALFDNTRLAVRIVPAIVGILTVLLLYVLLRRSFGAGIALLGAGTLGALGWHIHFARLGYPLEAWPLVVLAAAWTLGQAVDRDDWRWWAAAGGLTGAGIYVYNAHPLYIGLSYAFIGLYLLISRRDTWHAYLRGVTAFTGALLVTALPMIRYAIQHRERYFYHFEQASMRDSAEWQALDFPVEHARFILTRYIEFWNRLSFNPELDVVDGTGITPIVPVVTLLLAVAGMIVALLRYRRPFVQFAVLLTLLLPFGLTLTEGALARRTFPIAVFAAVFIAIGSVEFLRIVWRQKVTIRYTSAGLLVGVLTFSVYANLDNYFDDFADASTERNALAKEFAAASTFMSRIPDTYYVYFYSEKWSIDYQPRLFLAPETNGEDRSERFGDPGFTVDWLRGQPMFVFLGNYRENLNLVHALYPGGKTMIAGPVDDPDFIAYEPPLPPR